MFLKALHLGEVKEVSLIVNDNGVVTDVRNGVAKELCKEFECFDLTKYGVAVPGFIDIHTHLRGLELSYKEDEESGSKAAAKGGYVVVVDMPNTIPKINSVEAFKQKLDSLTKKSYVDFGISIAPPSNEKFDEFETLIKRCEVVAVGELFPDEHRYVVDIIKLMNKLNIKKPILIHPEHLDFVNECEKGFRWLCRPLESELKSVIEIGKKVSVSKLGNDIKIHITHVTNPLSLVYAKIFGFTVDTAPHYLYLSSIDEESKGCLAKVNPPLRHYTTKNALIHYIRFVDAIASDHAPHSYEEKCMEFMQCPSGISSIEVASALILNLVAKNILKLDEAIRLLSKGPSTILGLRRWGCFERGCIASYTVIDLQKEWVIDSSKFYSKAAFSPYDGLKVRGSVEATIVRGTIVYVDNGIVAKPLGKPIGCLNA